MGVRLSAAAALSAGLVASIAGGDFTGFSLKAQVVVGALDTYRVVRAYAHFDNASDTLLNVFDASLTLSYRGSAVPGLLQATDADLEIGPTYRPFAFVPTTEPWAFDSFVTIGSDCAGLCSELVAPELLGGGGWRSVDACLPAR